MTPSGDDDREDERSEARERALGLLYEAEAKRQSVDDVLDALALPADPLAELLVRGVSEHQERIDELITANARNWTLERMPVIDRTVLRMSAGRCSSAATSRRSSNVSSVRPARRFVICDSTHSLDSTK